MAELFEVAELAGVTDVADVQRYCDEQARHILAHCDVRGLKIACAESLTAGLLADSFVRIPGASSVFLGSAVTYDIHAKAMVLGVDAELLRVIQERDFALRLALRGSRELVRHLTVACVLGKMREFTGSSQEKIPIMETRETHEG